MSSPALLRLLSRRSSIDLLRLLVGTPVRGGGTGAGTETGRLRGRKGGQRAAYSSAVEGGDLGRGDGLRNGGKEFEGCKCGSRYTLQRRKYHESPRLRSSRLSAEERLDQQDAPHSATAQAVGFEFENIPAELQTFSSKSLTPGNLDSAVQIPSSSDISGPRINYMITKTHEPSYASLSPAQLRQEKLYGRWWMTRWTHQDLDSLSDLDHDKRLLNARKYMSAGEKKQNRIDPKLFAYLLDFRERVYGLEGIRTFLTAARLNRDLELPTGGPIANKIWESFLTLGLSEPSDDTLIQIIKYAKAKSQRGTPMWSKFYVTILEHFLVNGPAEKARIWHQRLFPCCPPSRKDFSRLCNNVIVKHGDIKCLKEFYVPFGHKEKGFNLYSRIIPLLCAQEDFYTAYKWHCLLFSKGDLPKSYESVEPLVHFLAIYHPRQAASVTKSLVQANVSFAANLEAKLTETKAISREMINRVHGVTFHIPVKPYNDSLGARWFATTWISVDTTINAVHALGIEEIGPLSLQAICLRDPDIKTVMARLDQLKTLGISIGTSLYARAIDRFARTRNSDHLESLLKSDQHPDELENAELQEELLAAYARAGDFLSYRRTLRIRSLASNHPKIEHDNLILRNVIRKRRVLTIIDYITEMRKKRIPVTAKSIDCIRRNILIPRLPGKKPLTSKGTNNRGQSNDLNKCIYLLKFVMKSGSFVPITRWREIVRRLGMLGRWHDLKQLCLFLANWYGKPDLAAKYRKHRFRVPACVPTNHQLHPLRILFNINFQKAVVEWGFIVSLRRRPKHRVTPSSRAIKTQTAHKPLPHIAKGITLLKQLNDMGIWINNRSVRKAVVNRLIVYFGSGKSARLYNRVAKEMLKGRLQEVAVQVDKALGGTYFTGVELEKLVQRWDERRWKRVGRERWRRNVGGMSNGTLDRGLLVGPKGGRAGERVRVGMENPRVGERVRVGMENPRVGERVRVGMENPRVVDVAAGWI